MFENVNGKVKVILNPENADKKEMIEFMQCQICSNVVWDPVLCPITSCDKLYCRDCIELWCLEL